MSNLHEDNNLNSDKTTDKDGSQPDLSKLAFTNSDISNENSLINKGDVPQSLVDQILEHDEEIRIEDLKNVIKSLLNGNWEPIESKELIHALVDADKEVKYSEEDVNNYLLGNQYMEEGNLDKALSCYDSLCSRGKNGFLDLLANGKIISIELLKKDYFSAFCTCFDYFSNYKNFDELYNNYCGPIYDYYDMSFIEDIFTAATYDKNRTTEAVVGLLDYFEEDYDFKYLCELAEDLNKIEIYEYIAQKYNYDTCHTTSDRDEENMQLYFNVLKNLSYLYHNRGEFKKAFFTMADLCSRCNGDNFDDYKDDLKDSFFTAIEELPKEREKFFSAILNSVSFMSSFLNELAEDVEKKFPSFAVNLYIEVTKNCTTDENISCACRGLKRLYKRSRKENLDIGFTPDVIKECREYIKINGYSDEFFNDFDKEDKHVDVNDDNSRSYKEYPPSNFERIFNTEFFEDDEENPNPYPEWDEDDDEDFNEEYNDWDEDEWDEEEDDDDDDWNEDEWDDEEEDDDDDGDEW